MNASSQTFKPALVNLLSLTCDVDISGMATLRGVFTVKRTNSEEIVPNEEEIWVNGTPSAAVASEPSPATWDPQQQLWTHTYEFEVSAQCEQTYNVFIKVKIKAPTSPSNTRSVTCGACPSP